MTFGRYDHAAFLTYIAYAAGSVVAPVSLVSLARDLGFRLEAGGMTAGGSLQIGRTVALVVALLLCGFWAARWGKRGTLGVSVLLMGIGMAGVALAPTYGVVFLALIVAGVGEGVIEGLATPFIQDLHPDDPGRYVNFTHAFWSVGVLITVLAAGALLAVGVSWRVIVGAASLGALVPALVLLLPPGRGTRPYPESPERPDPAAVWARARAILRLPPFWLFFGAMFVAGGGEFCLTFWSASFIQLTFGASPWIGAVGTACFAAGMALGRLAGGYWVPQHRLRPFLLYSAAVGVLVSIFLPLTTYLTPFLALLFFAGIATAPFWPTVQSYAADRLPQVDTTLLMILLSAAGIPGCGFATWLTGYIGDRGGLGVAFYLVPVCYLLLGLLIAFESRRRVPPAADR
jgi:Fucose permease